MARKNKQKLERQEGKLLPKREAMSLITTGSTMPVPVEDFEAMTASDPSGASGAASGVGDSAAGLADTSADASGSGEESVVSEDRSEHFSASDSASAES